MCPTCVSRNRNPGAKYNRVLETPIINVILHHKMSRNVPDGHFYVLYFLKVNSMLFTMMKTIFKSED